MAAMALAPALPAIGRFAMQYLPLIVGGSAAAKPLMEGRPLDALVQGGLGYLGGKGLQGPVTGLTQQAMARAPGLAGAVGLGNLGPALSTAAGIGIPSLATALAPKVAQGLGGTVSQVANPVAQTAAGTLGYRAPGSPYYGGSGFPPGTGMYGGVSPYGSPLDVLGPAGMGQRLQTIKDAETMRDAMRLLNPEILAASEARSKKEFERNMAAAGIRQNIATRAAMQQKAQEAGLRAGLTAAQQAGAALTQQYQYQ